MLAQNISVQRKSVSYVTIIVFTAMDNLNRKKKMLWKRGILALSYHHEAPTSKSCPRPLAVTW